MHRPKMTKTRKQHFFPLFQIFEHKSSSQSIGVKTFMTFVNNANVKEVEDELFVFMSF